LTNILCLVDFSPLSYEAIEKASFLATLFQADLTLLHVIQVLPRTFGVTRGLDRNAQELMGQAEEDARTLLREAKKKYVPYAVSCKSSLRKGKISQEILDDAERLHTDLIVMAAPNGEEQKNHLREVMRKASCPVLTYNSPTSDSNGQTGLTKGFRKILIPLRADINNTNHLREYVGKYLAQMSPDLVLTMEVAGDISEEQRTQLQEAMKQEANQLQAMGLSRASVCVLESKGIADRLSRLAKKEGCDLILMDGQVNKRQKSERENLTFSLIQQAEVPVFSIGALASPRKGVATLAE
jgi:nucleotide-binding universal stress UspA family protein